MRIAIEGFGKPSKMKKNSKQLLKKLGIPLKEIIKGTYAEQEEQSVKEMATNSNNSSPKHKEAKRQANLQKAKTYLTTLLNDLPSS